MGRKKTKPCNYKLGFGKYADFPIRNIPSSYLEWLLENNIIKKEYILMKS